jgi:CTP synthase
MISIIRHPSHEVEIAIVGKYVRLRDAYKSIYEALDHAGASYETRVKVRLVEAENIEKTGAAKLLKGSDGILVPGGFGHRGIEGKIAAVEYARKSKTPFLGLCLGMQCAVIEFARNVCALAGATSEEWDPKAEHQVIALMAGQKDVQQMGGTMRLGAFPCVLKSQSLARSLYRAEQVQERHRHRYEFNNNYREIFERHGMEMSGVSPDDLLVETVELRDHPYFIATQAHPEFKSEPTRPHPLFRGLVKAALTGQGNA